MLHEKKAPGQRGSLEENESQKIFKDNTFFSPSPSTREKIKSVCRYFDECSAPLCPESGESLQACAWFPDEEICRRADHTGLLWIKRQKRIARATGKELTRGCFSHVMLCQDCRITGGIKGIDPEAGEITTERVHAWCKVHPAITEESRAKSRAQAQKNMAFRPGFGSPKRQNTGGLLTSEPKAVSAEGGQT